MYNLNDPEIKKIPKDTIKSLDHGYTYFYGRLIQKVEHMLYQDINKVTVILDERYINDNIIMVITDAGHKLEYNLNNEYFYTKYMDLVDYCRDNNIPISYRNNNMGYNETRQKEVLI